MKTALTLIIAIPVGIYVLFLIGWSVASAFMAIREGIRRSRAGDPIVTKDSYKGSGNVQ